MGREWTSEQDGYRELIVSWSIFIDWTANPADVSVSEIVEMTVTLPQLVVVVVATSLKLFLFLLHQLSILFIDR